MDIYDPIGVALGLEPMHFEFKMPKSSNPVPAWNKGINHFGSKENHPLYNKKHSDETKAKIASKAKNRVISEDTRKKMSEVRKGKLPPCSMLGKTHSEETKNKMRNSNRGVSQATREAQRKAVTGRKLSEETKNKMRIAALNRNKKNITG